MPTSPNPSASQPSSPAPEANALRRELEHHVVSMLGNGFSPPRRDTYYQGLAYCVRTRLIEKWLETQRAY